MLLAPVGESGTESDGSELGLVQEQQCHLIVSVLQGRNLMPANLLGANKVKSYRSVVINPDPDPNPNPNPGLGRTNY